MLRSGARRDAMVIARCRACPVLVPQNLHAKGRALVRGGAGVTRGIPHPERGASMRLARGYSRTRGRLQSLHGNAERFSVSAYPAHPGRGDRDKGWFHAPAALQPAPGVLRQVMAAHGSRTGELTVPTQGPDRDGGRWFCKTRLSLSRSHRWPVVLTMACRYAGLNRDGVMADGVSAIYLG